MSESARWVSLAAAVLVVGCTTIGGGRPRTAASAPRQAEDASTSDRIVELQRKAAMAEAEIRLLRRNLAALQIEMERLSAEAERAAAPPEPPGASVTRFEVSDLEPVRLEPPPAPDRTEPGASAPVAPSSTPRETAPGGGLEPSMQAAAPVPLAGQSIYDRGYTLYHQGRYIDAESSFQRFLQAHGDTELADNAQFWIGESRFARDDYSGALAAFQEVIDRYPAGNKVGDALLKTGDCLARLGDRAAAERRYADVVERFPGSAAAGMAEERLGRSPR